jgi:hypothetical protein
MTSASDASVWYRVLKSLQWTFRGRRSTTRRYCWVYTAQFTVGVIVRASSELAERGLFVGLAALLDGLELGPKLCDRGGRRGVTLVLAH